MFNSRLDTIFISRWIVKKWKNKNIKVIWIDNQRLIHKTSNIQQVIHSYSQELGGLATHVVNNQEKIIIHKQICKIEDLRGLQTWLLPLHTKQMSNHNNGSPTIYL